MKIRTIRGILVSLCMLAFVACTATTGEVFTDSDPQANFNQMQNFTWTAENPMVTYGNYEVTSRTQQNVMAAIRSVLSEKGYSYVSNSAEADFAVSIIVGASDGSELLQNNVPPMLYDSDWRWAYKYGPQIYVNQFTEGVLVIDLIDISRESPIWHGRGSKRLSRSELRQDDDSESVNAAVQDILATLPSRI